MFGCPFLAQEQPGSQASQPSQAGNSVQNQSWPDEIVVDVSPRLPVEPEENRTAVQPENATPPQPPQSPPSPAPTLKKRAGYVNGSEIGGSGFVVVSGYDPGSNITFENKTAKRSYFNTTVSREMPHVVYLKDKDHIIRAMAVSLPLDPAYLVFDARSTAKASLWAGGNLSQMENERLLAQIGYLDCWGNLYGYLQRKLPKNNMDNLTSKDWDYNNFRTVCIREMNRTGLPNPD